MKLHSFLITLAIAGTTLIATAQDMPKRQADGSVFLPKISQRQLGVRTVVTEAGAVARTTELTGRVLMDPNAGGQVQALQPGRIEAGPRGLPRLGQAVHKGETLAIVRAAASAIEQANQQGQAAELAFQLDVAQRRAERLTQLEGTVAQKEIEQAQAEVTALRQRHAAVRRSVLAAEALVAPVSGVVAAAHVVVGQVVDAREVLFEIVDPQRLVVEALGFDASAWGDITSAVAVIAPGVSVKLRFLGAGRSQREGAIALQFAVMSGQTATLAVNQPVKVLVHRKASTAAISVPASALVKNAANQDIVWIHKSPENFAPKTVRTLPLDGTHVAVVEGLQAGERVVSQGAALINQVR